MRIPSHTARYVPVVDSLEDDSRTNDWIIDICKPQEFDNLAVPLFLLDLLDKQNVINSVGLFWPKKPGYPYIGFYKGNDGLRHR